MLTITHYKSKVLTQVNNNLNLKEGPSFLLATSLIGVVIRHKAKNLRLLLYSSVEVCFLDQDRQIKCLPQWTVDNIIQIVPVLKNMPMKKTKICASVHKWKTVRFRFFNSFIANCIVDKIGGDATCGLFAIFDGHGGKQVSEYCAERFPVELKKELAKAPLDLCKPLTDIFAKVIKRFFVYQYRSTMS